MKTYNRSLDYLALAMVQMRAGKIQAATKLFLAASRQPDAIAAVEIIETSNAHAAKLTAKAKLRAEALIEDDVTEDGEDIEEVVSSEDDALDEVEDDLDTDDLEVEEEIDEEEVTAKSRKVKASTAKTMANLLASMVRK